MIERLTEKINGKTVHSWGSNFYIEPDNTTVENEYQAAKTRDLMKKAEILTICGPDGVIAPGWAKKLGQKVKLRDHWEDIKVGLMEDLVLRKALDHAEFVEWLLETGREQIVEGNWWHDRFWGVCLCNRCGNDGSNHLGRILMSVRDTIIRFDEGQRLYG